MDFFLLDFEALRQDRVVLGVVESEIDVGQLGFRSSGFDGDMPR